MNRVIKKQIEIMDFHSIAVTATWIAIQRKAVN